jgi:DNA-binding IclR family transcriptional regulator
MTRTEILMRLQAHPHNTNQLAKLLNLDYKTVQHHLDVLVENRLLSRHGKYGGLYFLTPELEAEKATLREIWGKSGRKLGKSTLKKRKEGSS